MILGFLLGNRGRLGDLLLVETIKNMEEKTFNFQFDGTMKASSREEAIRIIQEMRQKWPANFKEIHSELWKNSGAATKPLWEDDICTL